MALSRDDIGAMIHGRLQSVIDDARRNGMVVEVRLEPLPPLRMGRYTMVPSVRDARVMAPVAGPHQCDFSWDIGDDRPCTICGERCPF